MMKLSVIIVNYNVRYYLEQCLCSVLRATEGIECEIFVVDNHSRDNSVEYISQRFGHAITLIESNHNLGFARANNLAIRQSAGQYVLLLNPDTFVAEDSIRATVQFMDEHPQVGGVGVHMYNPDGTTAPESRRCLPTPWVSLLKMLGKSKRYYMSHLSWDEPQQIEIMSGAFCLLRREALDKVGLLDKDFFMYGEDIDLSYRIMKGGYENWYVPASIVHYKGESSRQSSFRYVHVFYQAMLIFFRKHYSHLNFLLTMPIQMAIYFRAFIALIQILYWRARQSLGFYERQNSEASYLFVGGDEMLNECRLLARRKGLMAQYAQQLDGQQLSCGSCVVFDVEAFSYRQIIDAMKAHAEKGWVVGTYSRQSKVLITPKEIIK